MLTRAVIEEFAAYNRWQNGSHIRAASTLTDAQRWENKGAHFGSIAATLNHVLWGDQLWMSRFAGTPAPSPTSIPASTDYFSDWDAFAAERITFDDVILNWARGLDPAWLQGDLTWFSGAANRELTKPRWVLVLHMFNHQTHHRGQVHAMLTGAGCQLDATDIPFRPED